MVLNITIVVNLTKHHLITKANTFTSVILTWSVTRSLVCICCHSLTWRRSQSISIDPWWLVAVYAMKAFFSMLVDWTWTKLKSPKTKKITDNASLLILIKPLGYQKSIVYSGRCVIYPGSFRSWLFQLHHRGTLTSLDWTCWRPELNPSNKTSLEPPWWSDPERQRQISEFCDVK